MTKYLFHFYDSDKLIAIYSDDEFLSENPHWDGKLNQYDVITYKGEKRKIKNLHFFEPDFVEQETIVKIYF